MSEYSYPMFNDQKKVICQLCGKPYLVISPRHLERHNIKYDEYKLRFPDAPLSSEEFNAISKYGKEKVIFVETELTKFKDKILDEDVEKITIEPNDDEPSIEDEIELRAVLEGERKETDIIAKHKNKILDHLRTHFTNIQKDFKVRNVGMDGRLKFEFITDFCDPVLKLIFQFPKTFWHNSELAIDPNKNEKLKQSGWKVIEFKSLNPSLQDIEIRIKSL